MVGDKKKKFGTTGRALENILYTTHINHIQNRNKQTDWFWLDKSSKQHELTKNNMARYISKQVMF